jgi:hypothetical protein
MPLRHFSAQFDIPAIEFLSFLTMEGDVSVPVLRPHQETEFLEKLRINA